MSLWSMVMFDAPGAISTPPVILKLCTVMLLPLMPTCPIVVGIEVGSSVTLPAWVPLRLIEPYVPGLRQIADPAAAELIADCAALTLLTVVVQLTDSGVGIGVAVEEGVAVAVGVGVA